MISGVQSSIPWARSRHSAANSATFEKFPLPCAHRSGKPPRFPIVLTITTVLDPGATKTRLVAWHRQEYSTFYSPLVHPEKQAATDFRWIIASSLGRMETLPSWRVFHRLFKTLPSQRFSPWRDSKVFSPEDSIKGFLSWRFHRLDDFGLLHASLANQFFSGDSVLTSARRFPLWVL